MTRPSILKRVHGLLERARGRHLAELLKFAEIKLLGRHASPYCWYQPSHVLIELTTRCNLRCVWCNQSDPAWQKSYGHQDMPFDMFRRIVAQLKGTRVLLLYNIGEPLLYKRLSDAVRLARPYVPEVRITSNGLLWTAQKARELAAAGLTQVNISIDSPVPALMQRIRGADLAVIEQTLRDIYTHTDLPVEIWTVLTTDNLESVLDLPVWAKRFSAIRFIRFQLQKGVHSVPKTGLTPLSDTVSFERYRTELARRCREAGIASNIESLPFYGPDFVRREVKGICQAPFNQLVAINVRGEMAPCCTYGTFAVGSVDRDGFQGVYNGPTMIAWRKDMLHQRYCSYCSNWCGFKEGQPQANCGGLQAVNVNVRAPRSLERS